ncbi:KUP/HAK/KT family potassium transporter, partial [Rhizobium johnstonii]|uniref:KUP/HAK/KT family potassium transporter n=1 Tax=Rhizobium johnstonii TaxID=3019933 RepID=UPI003F9E28B6
MTEINVAEPVQRSDIRKFLMLLLGSIGVVYVDIGTSPLYAFREALRPVSHDGI